MYWRNYIKEGILINRNILGMLLQQFFKKSIHWGPAGVLDSDFLWEIGYILKSYENL